MRIIGCSTDTCVELASEQATRDLTEVCQDLEQQCSVPCQATSEGADGKYHTSVLPLELPADLLPLPHQLRIRLAMSTHVLHHNPGQSLHNIWSFLFVQFGRPYSS